MSSSDEDEDITMDCDPPSSVVPNKKSILPITQIKYRSILTQFQKWNESIGGNSPVSEPLLLKYFTEMAETSKPSTLFAKYSMLKDGLRQHEGIDISKYSQLLEFLKEKNTGYKSVKGKFFTDEEIEKFINEAPDDNWLDSKVICIFATSGADNKHKLLNVMVKHVKRYDDLILVTICRTENTPQRTFTITGPYVNVVQKYAVLRPENALSNRFFMTYMRGRCTTLQLGKGKLATIPKKIATYLQCPEPERYSLISFRRSSGSNFFVNANPWNPVPFDDEDDGDQQTGLLDYQTGLLKTPSMDSCMQPTTVTSASTFPSFTTTNGLKMEKIENGSAQHVCTLSCANVKCASEENESSALHAFTVMKPSKYVITDITATVFPAEPVCRWIVAYTHKREAVTVCNAAETFEQLTRSIPSNVRVNQKYIRGDLSQSSAAYVVVYGVNCVCHKETDVFGVPVNEMKCEF